MIGPKPFVPRQKIPPEENEKRAAYVLDSLRRGNEYPYDIAEGAGLGYSATMKTLRLLGAKKLVRIVHTGHSRKKYYAR